MIKIRNKLLQTVLFLMYVFSISNGYAHTNAFKVAVVIPMEHLAMNDIIGGIKKELEKDNNNDYQATIYNAQGDINLMKLIYQQIFRSEFDAIVPVGTIASQFAVKLIKDKPIISIDSDLKEEKKIKNFVNIESNNSYSDFTNLIQHVLSNSEKLYIIHSNDIKIFKKSSVLANLIKSKGYKVQIITVNNLYEVLNAIKILSRESGAILVLRDNLLVSAMPAIVREVKKTKIKLIASDEGSIKNGADIAIGVQENELGKKAAELLIEYNKTKTLNKKNSKIDSILFKNASSSIKIDPKMFHNKKIVTIK